MLEKLKILQQRFNELSDLLTQPDIISDQSRYIKISKEFKELKTVVDKKNDYEAVLSNISEAKEIIKNENDKEMIELANLELDEAQVKVIKIEDDLKKLLIDQIEKRVRWRESILFMIEKKVESFIEIGPGKVLSGLIKRIDKNVKIRAINSIDDIKNFKNE